LANCEKEKNVSKERKRDNMKKELKMCPQLQWKQVQKELNHEQ